MPSIALPDRSPPSFDAIHNLKDKPDIALLDYFLEKDYTGMDILKKLKQRFPNTQVIFLTASDDVNIAVDTMRNGAYDYIVKGDTAFIRIRHLLKKISEEKIIFYLFLSIKIFTLSCFQILLLLKIKFRFYTNEQTLSFKIQIHI